MDATPYLLSLRRVFTAFLLVLVASVALVSTAQAQDATATPAYSSGTVLVQTLNIRSGPGTSARIIEKAHSGDILVILAKNADCSWVQVTSENGTEGWASANARFLSMDTACAALPVAEGDVSATAAATPVPAATGASPAAAPNATPTVVATAAPAADAASTIPEGKGCIDFGNWAGPDVIISGSLKDSNEIFDVTIKNKTVERVCLTPGRWGVTISAIANFWRDLVLDFEVKPGEVIDFPLVQG
jgi:serine protease Do